MTGWYLWAGEKFDKTPALRQLLTEHLSNIRREVAKYESLLTLG